MRRKCAAFSSFQYYEFLLRFIDPSVQCVCVCVCPYIDSAQLSAQASLLLYAQPKSIGAEVLS